MHHILQRLPLAIETDHERDPQGDQRKSSCSRRVQNHLQHVGRISAYFPGQEVKTDE